MTRMKQVSHSIYYEMTSEDKKRYERFIQRKIKLQKDKNPLFKQMMDIVNQYTTHYHSDFYVHDFNAFTIELGKDNTFIWNVYDCGSRLIRLESDFEEDQNSRWDYYQTLAKSYFKSSKLYLVDIKQQKLTEINPSSIDKSYFSSRYGKNEEYFEREAMKNGHTHYYEWKQGFKSLVEEYRNHPPKEKIDSLFSSRVQRNII